MLSLLFLAIGLALSGCSGVDQSDLYDSTVIKKEGLNGEWFSQATLVSKNSHSQMAFVGLQCPADRIRFEFTKDKLLAYRSYDRDALLPRGSSRQTLVASFNIIEHLDKALQEDHSLPKERKWHEREYARIDWSNNLAPHIECNGWLKSITVANLRNIDNKDLTDPYPVRVEDDYLEATINAIVTPDKKTCRAIGEHDCHAANYRVKFSFKKVDSNNDYQARHYPDFEPIRYGIDVGGKYCLSGSEGCSGSKELWLYQDSIKDGVCDPLSDDLEQCYLSSIKLNSQFGFFRTEVQGYQRKKDFSRRERQQLINRRNIWQRSVNEQGELIPMKERIPRKITYYLNPGFPKSLLPSVRKVQEQWNIAFANVLAKAKNDCSMTSVIQYVDSEKKLQALKRVGIDRINKGNLKRACTVLNRVGLEDERGRIFLSGDPQEIIDAFGNLFEIKENSCNRKNVLSFADRNGLSGLLHEHGIWPLTDENIEMACALLEGRSKELHMDQKFSWQQPGDLRYSFVNAVTILDSDGLLGYGPISVDPKTGEIISGNANIYLPFITSYATHSALMLDQLEQLPESLQNSEELQEDIEDFSSYVGNAIGSMKDSTFRFTRKPGYQIANMAKVLNLNLFASFRGWSLGDLGHRPGSDMAQVLSAIVHAEGAKDGNHSFSHDHGERDRFFSERSACFAHRSFEIPYARLKEELSDKPLFYRIDYIKKKIFESVLLHELGHTFGLRHNFKGAYDALNFPPNFWGVDTADFRMRSGLSDEELRSSSVMDYHKRFNSDFSGLGLYDYAALLSGYGGMMEVFDTEDEDFVPQALISHLKLMNYRDIPYILSGAGAEFKISRHIISIKDRYRRGDMAARVDIRGLGLKSRPENIFKRQAIDYQELKKEVFSRALFKKSRGLMQVPYAYCSDKQAYGHDIACQPFIHGSSVSEIIKSSLRDYQLEHMLENAVGGVLTTHVPSYLSSGYNRVYLPILRAYQSMYLMSRNSLKIYPAIHDLTIAAKRGLDFISQVLQEVEPGDYCLQHSGEYLKSGQDVSCENPITIDKFAGRKYHSTISDDLIGQHQSIGYFYDKLMALMVLVDDHMPTIADDIFLESQGGYSIGYYRLFAPQLLQLFIGLYMNDWKKLAPRLRVDDQNIPHVQYRDLFVQEKNPGSNSLPLIKPGMSPKLRELAILFSIAGLSNPLDQRMDFAKRAQISKVRSTGETKVDDPGQVMTFKDPNTGISYRASVAEDEEESLGYLLLKDAQRFVSDGPWGDAKRSLVHVTSKLQKHKSDDVIVDLEQELKEAQSSFQKQNEALNDKVSVIEQVFVLSNRFAN